MVKNAFLMGCGLGLVAGTYLIKHCQSVRQAFDSAEDMVKCKVDKIKDNMKQKKQSKNQSQDSCQECGMQFAPQEI